MQQVQLTIEKRDYFDLKQNLVFLTRSDQEILHVITDDSIFKVMTINGKQYVIKLHEHRDLLIVTFLNEQVTERIKNKVKRYVVEWFDLDRDIRPFYVIAEKDDVLHSIVQKYKGYRIVGIPDLFESFTWAILGQQINITFAYRLKRRLVETYGSTIQYNDKEIAVFPSAETIATLNENDLRKLQISNRKAQYIIGIANMIANKNITKDKLMKLDDETLEKKLTNIRGVGKWTAHYVMMRTLRRTNAFPVQDVGIKRAFQQALGLKTRPTMEQMQAHIKRWSGWEAYAAFYLWRTLYEEES